MTAQSTIVSEAVERGDVKVVGGIYSLSTGHVAFS
jgi:carbonic anhydrase